MNSANEGSLGLQVFFFSSLVIHRGLCQVAQSVDICCLVYVMLCDGYHAMLTSASWKRGGKLEKISFLC